MWKTSTCCKLRRHVEGKKTPLCKSLSSPLPQLFLLISPSIWWKKMQTKSLIWFMTEEGFLKAGFREGMHFEHMKHIYVRMHHMVIMVWQTFWSCNVFIRRHTEEPGWAPIAWRCWVWAGNWQRAPVSIEGWEWLCFRKKTDLDFNKLGRAESVGTEYVIVLSCPAFSKEK